MADHRHRRYQPGGWALTVATGEFGTSEDEKGPDRHTALVETLSDCYVLADDLAQQRRKAEPDAASLDLVADCLAEDLLAAVFAAGLVLLVKWPEVDGQRASGCSDVADIVIKSGIPCISGCRSQWPTRALRWRTR